MRSFYKRFLLSALVFSISAICVPVYADTVKNTVQNELAALESSSGGKIGISAVDTGNHLRIQYRSNERFPIGCTAKVIGVAAILKKAMDNHQFLNERITYQRKDLADWAPIAKKHLHDGMTIDELSAAAISYSDNTAMNLLAYKLGGVKGLNSFARSIGDQDFKMTHLWPEEALTGPVDLADSTTPAAMENSLQKLALGDVLTPPLREKLVIWLKDNTTGDARIRAGVPKNWIVGDKTGTGFHYGVTNDIAIIWPPQCDPIVVAIYYTHSKKEAAKREDVIASATRIVIKEFARSNQCLIQGLNKA